MRVSGGRELDGALMVSPDLIDRTLRRFLVLGQAMRRDAETLPVSVPQSA